MAIHEGSIPTILGTVVTGVGATMLAKKMAPKVAAGVVGFGAAHIVLGAIDMAHHKSRWNKIKDLL